MTEQKVGLGGLGSGAVQTHNYFLKKKTHPETNDKGAADPQNTCKRL